ncbi:MAG: M20/M25/M40 family metallo-hydrolase [Spirochaetales bacterium]|nr:M20/M25/M40 family metallo-hydrolase [Spirochaetales bacterium]
MDIYGLFRKIDELEAEFLTFFKDIVTRETYATDKEAMDEQALFIKAFCEKLGFCVEVKHFPVSGDGLLLTAKGNGKLPPVAFTGHMDTVFPKGSWQGPLWREEGNLVFGPGVVDMKGGLVTGLLAMKALKDCGFSDRDIRFIFIPDEERSEGLSGEPGKDFIRDNSRGCAAAFTLEGGRLGYVTVARKGSIRYHVTVQGKAAHAGAAYAKGRSAIKEAAHKILDIESESDPEQITYNCGMIKGGTSPNTVPEFCEFMLYNRYWTAEQRLQIKSHVEGIIGKSYIPDTTSTFEVIGERPPMEWSESNMALFNLYNETSVKYGFGESVPCKVAGGSDATYTAQAGVPSLCSVGISGGNAHQLSEWADISSIKIQAKKIAAAIAEMPADFGVSGGR